MPSKIATSAPLAAALGASVIFRSNSPDRVADIFNAAITIRDLARGALADHATVRVTSSSLPSGVVVTVPPLDLRDRGPWLQAAARLVDLACTELIDACNALDRPSVFVPPAEDRFVRARATSRIGRANASTWARPTVDFAAEELISVIAALDAFLIDFKAA